MTLVIYETLEQGSDAWLAARCGLVTASTISKLITATLKVAENETSRGLTLTLAAERMTGFVEYVHPSFEMQRGTDDEPMARDMYAEHYAAVEQVGFMTRDFGSFVAGYSPDGLVGDEGLIEIKSRKAKEHMKTVLANQPPAENVGQLQMALLISGRPWIDYLSFSSGLELWDKRVYPDPLWQAAILDALKAFEENAARMIDAYKTATDGKPVAPRIDHYEEMSF
ncbi:MULTISPECIES: YqaJ viral recombinase family protein [unclassified Cryobacterium]|uniref:YqaJ viral recombinase family protein n=1 Tax=unclassified Cryobacterium TaxID=2649013 RepID=UPI001069A04C|nr:MULTISPECIES: YqaJ viral recombinase family protein [unclassified Cryobacterium]TFB96552.1 hypothetical protein E3O39_10800 [Cryobacterium sp. MDB2-A-1]TFC12836.1 hypothetical protein E3O35_07960 [Cryobacterium sp. MDB2-A-2]